MKSQKLFNEPHGVFFFIDNKSFYASCEAVQRGLNPLKTPLVVLSEASNTDDGLVLATSPEAKKLYHLKNNVSRRRDLPIDPRLLVVPPRMNLYIQKNLQINEIFKRFTAEEDLVPYSIDESLLDMTHSWRLFGDTVEEVAKDIQLTVRRELGLYTTIGIGENPVQAKIALDIYAKHDDDLIGCITYKTVPQKLWQGIDNITDVWSIGERTAIRLKKLGIENLYDLAHTNPYLISQQMGLVGEQLFALSWGIDRTNVKERIKPKSKSIGNSQVLARDYVQQSEIEIVIKEIGEQVAARLRHHHKQTTGLSLGIGFSTSAQAEDGRSGVHGTIRISASNNDVDIYQALLHVFHKIWEGQHVRNVAVYTFKLVNDSGFQLNLFASPERQIKDNLIGHIIDEIHDRFGFTALVRASSLLRGGTAIERASLVGGHNGGNAYE